MNNTEIYDFIIIGSGPGGHQAAEEALRHNKKVAVIEMERELGGACVHQGTIPSKTLRETANNLARFANSAAGFEYALKENVQVESLMMRKDRVRKAHVKTINDHLQKVDRYRGRGTLVGSNQVEVSGLRGEKHTLQGKHIIIATGSRPRTPPDVPVDHENILDSDSILSMIYLPPSLTVLGGGVIACEYATIFCVLGVEVHLIDNGPRPLRFLEPQLTDKFVASFESHGGKYYSNAEISKVSWDGIATVTTELADGQKIQSQKLMVGLGRLANVERLRPQDIGLEQTKRGHLLVNEHYQTTLPHIYAVGDVIGFPALASCSMEQGRRAVRHALNLPVGTAFENVPMGIYTIPEISSIGLQEEEARERYSTCFVGYADFDEIARGQISNIQDGLLKLICDPQGLIVGVHIIGEGSTELIHVAQMAILGKLHISVFVENVMNFPTLAEAYRQAAIQIMNQIHSQNTP